MDVAADYRKTIEELRRAQQRWGEEVGVGTPPRVLTEKQIEVIDALGQKAEAWLEAHDRWIAAGCPSAW